MKELQGDSDPNQKKRASDFDNAYNSEFGDDNNMANTMTNQNNNLPVNYNEKVYGNYIK